MWHRPSLILHSGFAHVAIFKWSGQVGWREAGLKRAAGQLTVRPAINLGLGPPTAQVSWLNKQSLKYTGLISSIINSTTPVLIADAPLLATFLGNQVCAGFPSPADDLGAQRIDLAQVLITHPQATYFLRARGHSMIDAGIFDNDILVVDRAIKPRLNHVVVAIVDGDLTVK